MAVLGLLATYNLYPQLDEVGDWEDRCRCIATALCCHQQVARQPDGQRPPIRNIAELTAGGVGPEGGAWVGVWCLEAARVCRAAGALLGSRGFTSNQPWPGGAEPHAGCSPCCTSGLMPVPYHHRCCPYCLMLSSY